MKKTSIVLVLILMFSFVVNCSADTAFNPVKDVCILSEHRIIVLLENGNLVYGTSIEDPTPKLITTNVKEFACKDSSEWYTAIGTILYYNGDIANFKFRETRMRNDKPEITIELGNRTKANARKVYADCYIDNNNVLKNNKEIMMKNVSEFIEPYYVITTSGDLYRYENTSSGPTFIINNVKNVLYEFQNRLAILRDNGDLYFQPDYDVTPVRIGTNVNSIDNVIVDILDINYIDNSGDCYHCSITEKGEVKRFYKYLSNAKYIYSFDGSNRWNRYVVTNDNVLYRFMKRNAFPSIDNAERIGGVTKCYSSDFYADIKGQLIQQSEVHIDDFALQYVYDIERLVQHEDLLLILRKNGELLGGFIERPTLAGYSGNKLNPPPLIETFLTSFCEKPAKIKINNKNVELSAKIQMRKNRSMYPFRECLENMGAMVYWDSVNQIAIGEYQGTTIEFPIGRNEYWINGIKYEMDVPSYIDESLGRTYIPIRYAAEGLGFIVDRIEDDAENTISIHK